MTHFGLGAGWRPQLAVAIDRRTDLGFIELLAEDFFTTSAVPVPVSNLQKQGVQVVPHGVSLSLGGAEPIDRHRVREMARIAKSVNAPLVSEHLAFVRGGGVETGHLLPVPRTREMLDIIVENVQIAQSLLPVPLALENIATLVDWPESEFSEAAFFAEVLRRTGALLLLDVENVYANCLNEGGDAWESIAQMPLDRLAYVHVAGGIQRDLYHDTHAAPVPMGVLDLVRKLSETIGLPGVMLERDDEFPSAETWNAEMDAIQAAMTRVRVTTV